LAATSALSLHSSNEPGELRNGFAVVTACTTNIISVIIIIIIIIITVVDDGRLKIQDVKM